jgi:quercetin dioxygenase-like cupin family protein
LQAKILRRKDETGGRITENKLIMENDRVRVLDVLLKPKDKAAMHSHPDHVVYVLKGGKLKLTSSGKTDVSDLKTGQAMFFKAQSHEAENTGKTDIELLVVELK